LTDGHDSEASRGRLPGWVIVLAVLLFTGLVGLIIVLSPRS